MKSNVNAFIAGIGTILESLIIAFNPQPLMKNNYYKSDSDALRNDWNMVGKSLKRGINEYKTSQTYTSTKK